MMVTLIIAVKFPFCLHIHLVGFECVTGCFSAIVLSRVYLQSVYVLIERCYIINSVFCALLVDFVWLSQNNGFCSLRRWCLEVLSQDVLCFICLVTCQFKSH